MCSWSRVSSTSLRPWPEPIPWRSAGRLLHDNPRARAVLDLAAAKAGWGQALPHGAGRGVCLQFAFNTYLATVLEVEVTQQGEIRLRRANVAVDCGPVVNPDTLIAQVQGGLIFGLSAALYSEITVGGGRVEQSNFHDYRVLRINEAPAVVGASDRQSHGADRRHRRSRHRIGRAGAGQRDLRGDRKAAAAHSLRPRAVGIGMRAILGTRAAVAAADGGSVRRRRTILSRAATIWRAPPIAPPATRCPDRRPSPAAAPSPRRSARSIRRTSRPTRKPASGATPTTNGCR